jgi:hypothetical protein
MKRRIATLIVAGVVLGGGAFAWAEAGPSRPSVPGAGSADFSVATLADSTQASPQAQGGTQDPAAFRQALQQCRQQAGIAQPQPGTPRTPPTAAQRQQVLDCLAKAGFNPGHGPKGRGAGAGAAAFLRRAIHGDLVVPDGNGGFKNVVFDRGTQDGAVSNNALTITRPDKVKVSVQLTDTTKYAGAQNQSQLQPGRVTVVVAGKDGKALLVAQPNRTREGGGNNRVTS